MQKNSAMLVCALSTLALNGCFLFGPGQAPAPKTNPGQGNQVIIDPTNGTTIDPSHNSGSHQETDKVIAEAFKLPEDHLNKLQAASLEPVTGSHSQSGLHFRIHLSVFKDGHQVTVPANFGVVENWGMANLHTHSSNGVFDVVADQQRDFTLGQLAAAWGVDISQAAVYVNGSQVAGGGAHILASRQEIALVFGTPPETIPSSYTFEEQ